MTLPSIHDNTPPLETGGIHARAGFIFQDHVAVKFLLEMLTNKNLQEVRCESQDDVTLIWNNNGYDEVEFVQAKGNELDQLWSVALLCKTEKKDGVQSKSIYEKLLANDRFNEDSRFRIVTRRDINNALEFLKSPLDSPLRNSSQERSTNLCDELNKRSGSLSKKKNGASYWISNTIWDVEHEIDTLITKNKWALNKYIIQEIDYLPITQVDNIYSKLLQSAQAAAYSDWRANPESKRFTRHKFISWVKDLIAKTLSNSSGSKVGKRMQEKMEAALIPSDYILTAHQQRKFYRKESLNPKYLDTNEREYLENEILSALQNLRAKLDTGELPNSGIEFHSACLSKIQEIQESPSLKTKPQLGLMHGYMYFVTGRCWHRFQKVAS